MLAQHLITKPVFDALFSDYSFAQHNPMSKAMQGVGNVLSKIPLIGGLLGGITGLLGKLIGSLFGTKTSITGQGIFGKAQSLGDVLGGGFDADETHTDGTRLVFWIPNRETHEEPAAD